MRRFTPGSAKVGKLCLHTIILWLGLATALLAQSQELSHIATLREKRAFDELDNYCRHCLVESNLPNAALVEIATSWLQARTQRAVDASPSERDTLWNTLAEVAELAGRAKNSPRGILIAIQLAISKLAHAESLLQDVADYAEDDRSLQAARSLLRTSLSELNSIASELEKRLRDTYQKSASAAKASGWTKTELESLRRNLALQQARGYRLQALSYAADSADRVNSLGLALQSLAQLSKSTSVGNEIWEAHVERLVCLRLLNKLTEARELLDQWQDEDLPPEIALKLHAESEQIEWSVQAEGGSSPQLQADPLLRSAERLYTAGKWQEAIAAYDRAANSFAKAGDEQQRFRAAKTAAAVARALGNDEVASLRFRQLALDQPKHAEAAETHLTAIGLTGILARESPEEMQRFEMLLQEHLEIWPRSKQANTVRLWLGRYWMSRQQWSEASRVLSGFDANAAGAIACAVALTDCTLQELQQLDSESPESDTSRILLVERARKGLQQVLMDSKGRWSREWNDLTRSAALKLSELLLHHSTGEHDNARKLLSAALASSPKADASWKLRASELLAEALSRGSHWSDVLRIVAAAQQIDHGLESKTTLALKRHQADALLAMGNRDQALAVLRELLDLYPQDGNLYESYVLILSDSQQDIELREALLMWQQIEKQSKPAGPRWIRARQARLELLWRLGEGELAEKLGQLTKLLYPQTIGSIRFDASSLTPQ